MSRTMLTPLLALAMALPLTAQAATYVVQELPGRVFSPADLTIATGDTVMWRNDDTMDHTSTSGSGGVPDGLWDSGNMAPGDTFSFTFTSAGMFDYYCEYHSNMIGRITVIDATATVQQLPGRVFSPVNLTVILGDTVLWVNADTMAHTTTSGTSGTPDGLFDSGDMPPGAGFAHTFTSEGVFDYYCDYHSGMTGRITVVAAAAATVQQLPGRIFQPATVTINVGQTVLWVNDDTMAHTTTSGTPGSPDGLFDSGDMPPGATFAYTFSTAGTFPYYCDYHSAMTGQVIVNTIGPGGALVVASKSGNDVVIQWTGGSPSTFVLRGQSLDPSDLAPLPGPVTSPFRDLNAILPPPLFYVYQVQ